MSIIKTIGKPFFGQKALQRFFSKMQLFALYGQSYGLGATVSSSGEKNVLKLVDKINRNKKELLIIDCGANVGDYSADADALIETNKKIVALEPVKDTFEKLEIRFKDHNNISTRQIGLGYKTETLTIYKSAAESKHASLYPRNMDHWDTSFSLNLSEDISVQNLTDFMAEQNIDHIDLLKMDAEGHELSILKGSQELIKQQKIDFIQFEFGVCNVDSKVFFKDFYSLLNGNYHILRILKNNFYLVDKYDERLEVFLTTNYLAVSDRIFNQHKSEIV